MPLLGFANSRVGMEGAHFGGGGHYITQDRDARRIRPLSELLHLATVSTKSTFPNIVIPESFCFTWWKELRLNFEAKKEISEAYPALLLEWK